MGCWYDKMAIIAFAGAHRFLSNFYPCVIHWNGMEFPSVEHAFVAAKCHDPEHWKAVQAIPADRANLAKRLGKTVKLQQGWDTYKRDLMECLLVEKFSQEPLRSMLLSTTDHELVEGNWWGDTYWGVCKGVGDNHLGKLLMKVRGNLQVDNYLTRDAQYNQGSRNDD